MRSVKASLTRPGARGHTSRPSIRSPAFFSHSNRLSSSSYHSSPDGTLPPTLVLVMQACIVLLVIWLEYGTFWSHASITCHGFDDSPTLKGRTWDPALGLTGGWTADPRWKRAGAQGHHVLVAADPQLLDMRAYPERHWLVRWLGVQFTDLYARKSWYSVTRNVRGRDGRGIHAVVWLGDLLDEGRKAVRGIDYAAYVARFHRTFPTPRSKPTKAQVPVVYLPGNHDLGLHPASSELGAAARERFKAAFGPLQGRHSDTGDENGWNGWEVIWVDSMALLEGDEAQGRAAREWVERVGQEPVMKPRVLLSHIPLFRPEGTSCGSGRESSRVLRQGQGQDYQNELDEQTTKWLLENIQPTVVYSGDDHDLCVVQHPTFAPESSTPVVETTVKAFSMAMGVRSPGYHLLTLYPPLEIGSPSSATYTQVSCNLPDQLGIWLHVYVPLVSIVLAALLVPKLFRRARQFVQRSQGGRSRRGLSSARSNGLPVTRPVGADLSNGSDAASTGHHSHKRSLSQKLLDGVGAAVGRGPSDEHSYADELAEDQDSQFPTFPFSPGTAGDEYGYHSPLDSDAVPTVNANFVGSAPGRGTSWGDDDRDDDDMMMRPSLRNVRRVSRVWSWDGADDDNDDQTDPFGTGHAARPHSLFAQLRRRVTDGGPVTGSERVDAWLATRLGPNLWTRALRPCLLTVRVALLLATWIPRRLLKGRRKGVLARARARDGVLSSTISQFSQLAWPGVATWVVVNWVWFGVMS